MQTFYGSLRALETEFLRYLSDKQPGPDRPVLVLCPSGRVAERLRTQLAEQNELVSNLYFVTFSQLLAALDNELPAGRAPLLPSDGLHQYILKKLLEEPGLDRYRLSRGFVTALQSSLRDMGDALAVPEVLEEHLQTLTDPVLLAEEAHLQWLVKVFKTYQEKMDEVPGFRSYQTYFSQALAQAEKSPWLGHFSEIILYGFYELTGRQLELFHTLRTHYAVTVFWLYSSEPAFAYGRKFFETNILGSATESHALVLPDKQTAAASALRCLFTEQTAEHTPAGLHFVSAPGPAREVFFVLKEMLRLHEQEGIAYSDMALTARSLEPYKTFLPQLCAQNGIPLQADFSFALTARPLGVFLVNLLLLVRGGFAREDVLAVVSSPYFKQPNNWRYLIDECLARRDFAQWQDLVRPGLKEYDPAFLTWMSRTKTQLEALEKANSWRELSAAAKAFLEENTSTDLTADEQNVWQQVLAVLQGFERYNAISPRAGVREFLDELLAALQNIQLHQVTQLAGGITAADVLNLRGLNFKVVFLLGVNEKSFPQLIREDPVLKDYYRRTLRDQLGFWINQKMERFDEERLLFLCTVEAAAEQLYCSFLRSDEEGKPLIISSYLVELARAAGVDLTKDTLQTVKMRLADALREIDFNYLTPKEVSMLLAAENAQDKNYQKAGLLDAHNELSLQAAREIASGGALNGHDGVIESGAEIFNTQNSKGFSPSALQDLGHCPMKYFLSKGLGLKEKDEVLSRSELTPNLRGEAYHKVLMDYYEHLHKEGLIGQLFDAALQERLDSALAAHYTPKNYKDFGIYPVVWNLILTDIHDKLSVFVHKDAAQLASYEPSLFETAFEGYYAPSDEIKLKLHGIMDRIDIDAQHKTFRVVDYKSGRHGGTDLAAYMFKEVILQPFIYLVLAQQMPQLQRLNADGAVLLNINRGYGRQELSAAAFENIKTRAADFFALLTQIIRQGRFFIRVSEHCKYCPYAAICRRDCFHSLLRARREELAEKLERSEQ